MGNTKNKPSVVNTATFNGKATKMKTKKTVTIVVNGTEHEVEKDHISFQEVVHLAYDEPPYGENTLFSVTYRRGNGNKPGGTLTPGECVKVKKGMIFDVTATDKS